jgi:hypothetical protein
MRSAAGNDGVDWGVPVLYARSAGGALFRPIQDEPARRQAERELAAVPGVQVTQNIGQVFGPVIGELHGNLGDLNFFAGDARFPAAPAEDAPPAGPVSGDAAATAGRRSLCPACGGDNPPGARFCELCGAALPRTCAHCGGALSPAARFCPACGTRVQNF